jgi:hypothetical protein
MRLCLASRNRDAQSCCCEPAHCTATSGVSRRRPEQQRRPWEPISAMHPPRLFSVAVVVAAGAAAAAAAVVAAAAVAAAAVPSAGGRWELHRHDLDLRQRCRCVDSCCEVGDSSSSSSRTITTTTTTTSNGSSCSSACAGNVTARVVRERCMVAAGAAAPPPVPVSAQQAPQAVEQLGSAWPQRPRSCTTTATTTAATISAETTTTTATAAERAGRDRDGAVA